MCISWTKLRQKTAVVSHKEKAKAKAKATTRTPHTRNPKRNQAAHPITRRLTIQPSLPHHTIVLAADSEFRPMRQAMWFYEHVWGPE
jgi:hypothetical protein